LANKLNVLHGKNVKYLPWLVDIVLFPAFLVLNLMAEWQMKQATTH